MAELEELEKKLSALRRDLAEMSREGCTPTQFLKLQRELVHTWAAIKDCKARRMPARLAVDASRSATDRDADVQKARGRNCG